MKNMRVPKYKINDVVWGFREDLGEPTALIQAKIVTIIDGRNRFDYKLSGCGDNVFEEQYISFDYLKVKKEQEKRYEKYCQGYDY